MASLKLVFVDCFIVWGGVLVFLSGLGLDFSDVMACYNSLTRDMQ